ncbi:MAG TPA: hypothetical protein VIL99_08300 [Ignavibacteria bacterium]
MITREHKIYNQLIISMLDKLSNINQWLKDFILETFVLFLSIRGRINFLQLARYGKHKEQRKVFSMSDIKTMNHNTILLQRFIDVFGITPYSIKNQKHFKELIYYGTMAA